MKKNIQIILHIFLLFAFLAGIYVCLTNGIINTKQDKTQDKTQENLQNKEGDKDTNTNCPDLLIKRDNTLLLYNTKMPEVDGVNPIPFFSLDDYINYLEIQRNKGIHCPVLFLQQENDAQGNDVYRMRPSPFYVEGGLPPIPLEVSNNGKVRPIVDASREQPPYNSNNYAGFDPYGQDIGQYTNIDQIHNSTMNVETGTNGLSDNPMDPNWGGIETTEKSVQSGKYDDNQVTRVIYPKVIPTM